jgi:hypothetical protein
MNDSGLSLSEMSHQLSRRSESALRGRRVIAPKNTKRPISSGHRPASRPETIEKKRDAALVARTVGQAKKRASPHFSHDLRTIE